MPTPLYTPRVNNNDDTVRLIRLSVKPGEAVRSGDIVAEVETDKASFTVEADRDGYVLAVPHEIDAMIHVGSVLLWIGDSAGDAVPADGAANGSRDGVGTHGQPTLKAAQLLARHGLDAGEVPASGERLTVSDVEAFLATRLPSSRRAPAADALTTVPRASGQARPLSTEERGMLRTVLWHRDEAVPSYVELQYDTAPWDAQASKYQHGAGLLMSPLLPLMAYRLAQLAAEHTDWNSTILGDERLVYDTVNLGMTVQSGRALYLAVVEGAARLSRDEFVARLGQLQRRAFGHALRANEVGGATVSFTSMARWQVSRHVPVLPPYTSLIVAHASGSNGVGTLGATYDHRVLTGFDALSAIRALSHPEALE